MNQARTSGGGDPDSYLSDESSFYGDDNTVEELEARVAAYDLSQYWKRHEQSIQTIAARGRDAESKAPVSCQPPNPKGKAPPNVDAVPTRKQSTLTPSSSSVSLSKTPPSAATSSRFTPPPTTTKDNHLQPYNTGEGFRSSKQSSESVSEFLARLPPSSRTTHDTGTFIWIYNPRSSYRPLSEDVATLKTEGLQLLSDHTSLRRDLELHNRTSPRGMITRKLKPHLTSLQANLFGLARRTRVTSGKWMLFPPPSQVDQTWSVVAHATFDGTLGIAAKVATKEEEGETRDDHGVVDPNRSRLICIYNDDFADVDEIRRILKRLRELGVVNDEPGRGEGSRAVYYKPDVWTHLGVFSGNEWKLRASLYSSRDADMR